MEVGGNMFMRARREVNIHETRIEYKTCVDNVNDYIARCSTDLYDSANSSLTYVERREAIMRYINDYINKHQPVIAEFINPANNTMDYDRLSARLIDEIVNYDILTDAMTDDEVTEIQINNGCVPGGIWVERHGKLEQLRDPVTDEYLYWESEADVTKFINNLLKFSKIQISNTKALVNGTTIEGYRIAATHSSATARTKGSDQRSPQCVIRKFSTNRLELEDLVRGKSLSSDMAAFLSILPRVNLTAAFCGSTGCGKTVMLQAMLRHAPERKRIGLIQNPAEVDVSELDDDGVEHRNFFSWEAKDIQGELEKDSTSPTYINMMNHALRSTPELFVFGELRSNEEFALSMKAAASGHYFYTTFHAEDAEGAINRYTEAVLSASGGSGGSEDLTVATICSHVRFIVVLRKLADGTRKCLSINEICGVDKSTGHAVPIINPIFKYFPDPNAARDENGFLKGYHAQVGTVSQRTKDDLILSGATPEDMKIINREVKPGQVIRCGYDDSVLQNIFH